MSENPYGQNNQDPNSGSSPGEYVPGSYSQGQAASSGPPQAPTAPAYQGNYGSGQQINYDDYSHQAQQVPGKGLGIASLVLGIVGLLIAFFGVGLIVGIVGLILGIIALVKLGKVPGSSKGMAVTGVILTSLAVLFGAVMTIVWVTALGAVGDATQQCAAYANNRAAYNQCIEDWSDGYVTDFENT